MRSSLFSFYLSFSLALSSAIEKRVVFDPKITDPHAGTVWAPGEKHFIKWSIADAPKGFPLNTATGMVVLGFEENDSENIDIDHPLASGFLIKDAQVQITVPHVPAREDYIVVLFGDSGNASPEFTIRNLVITPPKSSSAGAPPPSSRPAPSKPPPTLSLPFPIPTLPPNASGSLLPLPSVPASQTSAASSASSLASVLSSDLSSLSGTPSSLSAPVPSSTAPQPQSAPSTAAAAHLQLPAASWWLGITTAFALFTL